MHCSITNKLPFFILLFSFSAFTQVINVESLRKVTDTTGWHGTTSLNFSLTRNTSDLLRLGNNTHIQFKTPKNLFLLVGNIHFESADKQNFVNQGSAHFRHNYKLSDLLVLENFVQVQYNNIAKIGFRGLTGTGTRFKLIGLENYRLYFGSLLMFEYEEIENIPVTYNRDMRFSGYISISLYPTNNISVVSTTYYQPLLRRLSDHRFATENSLVVGIIDKLSLKTTYTLTFDSHPADQVNTTFYNLSTGLVYSLH